MDIHEEDNLAEIYLQNRIEEDEFDHFKKKLTLIVLILIAIVIISAIVCVFTGPRTIMQYFRKHPNTEWESTEPYIHISVNESGRFTAYMEIDGEFKQVHIYNSGNSSVTYIFDYLKVEETGFIINEYEYLNGDARYRSNKIIIKIDKDNVFNGKYPEIVLYRVG